LPDDNGEGEFIIHHVRDVTAKVTRWDGLDHSQAAWPRSVALPSRLSRHDL